MAPVKTPGRPRGTILGSVQAGLVTFTIRAAPLPESITNFLIANLPTLKKLQRDRRLGNAKSIPENDSVDDIRPEGVDASLEVTVEEFWGRLEGLCTEAGKEWVGVAEQVWAFGPRRIGPNLLIDRTTDSTRSFVVPFSLRRASSDGLFMTGYENDWNDKSSPQHPALPLQLSNPRLPRHSTPTRSNHRSRMTEKEKRSYNHYRTCESSTRISKPLSNSR